MAYPGLDPERLDMLTSIGIGDEQLKAANDKAIKTIDEALAKMTIGPNNLHSSWKGKTMNLLLLGKTGSGKSTTCNRLLGEDKFSESHRSKSCTSEIQIETCDFDGITLKVVDTPGVVDTEKDANAIIGEIAKVFEMLSSGIHGFVFVFNGGNPRFTAEEELAFNQIADDKGGLLGPSFLDHCFVVITRGETLIKRISLDEYLTEENEDNSKFGNLLNNVVARRVVVIDNKEASEYGKKGQMRQLMGLITNSLSPTSVFTNSVMKMYSKDLDEFVKNSRFSQPVKDASGLVEEKLSFEIQNKSLEEIAKLSSSQKDVICDRVTRQLTHDNRQLPADELLQYVRQALDNKIRRLTDPTMLEMVADVVVLLLRATGAAALDLLVDIKDGLSSLWSKIRPW